MKKINKILFYCILISFLHSCSGTSDAAKVLKNEKITNTDEFLVKKKQPLIIPPDINNIPEPRSMEKNNQNGEEKIKNILKIPRSTSNNNNSNSSTENSIIDKIRK